MLLKTLAVLCLAAVVSALPVEDIKAPIKEDSSPALGHGPVLDHSKPGPGLVAAPGPGLVAAPGPGLVAAPGPVLDAGPGPALDPALVPHKHAAKGESDLKTDATSWGLYRYPYNYGYYHAPRVYSYHTPTYYSYWNSYW